MLISPARKRYLFDGETFGTISLKSVLNSNVCTGGLVTASNNQVFGVLIFNFQRQYFSIWITFAKNFTYFEIYSFSNKKKNRSLLTDHFWFVAMLRILEFEIVKLFFAVSSVISPRLYYTFFPRQAQCFLTFLQFDPEMFLINFGSHLKMATYSVPSFVYFFLFFFSNFR